MSSVRNSNKADLKDFVCETEVIENDGIKYHFLHNAGSGEWKKSKECAK